MKFLLYVLYTFQQHVHKVMFCVNQTFDVKLIRVNGDAVLGSVTSVRIAILKNDSPTGFFRFATTEVISFVVTTVFVC